MLLELNIIWVPTYKQYKNVLEDAINIMLKN